MTDRQLHPTTSPATKTVLLCDAAFSAIPILLALKRYGFRVAVCGSRPMDPGHALADLSLVMDYGDRERLLAAAKDEKIDYIVPGCTDVSYLSSAWVAEQLQLPGYDSVEAADIIHNKQKFRQFCQEHGFPTPRATPSLSEVSSLNFPLLIKPSDSFSGKGIVKVDDLRELSRASEFAKAESRTHRVLFEEFVEGRLYSHSAFLRNGKVNADFFVSEYCTVHPYQVNSSCVCLDLEAKICDGLRRWLENFASVHGSADGLMHTQFISDGDRFFLIEPMRRCPGDLYAGLITRSTGIDYAAMYVAGFCGLDIPRDDAVHDKRYISRHTVSVERDCTYLSSGLAVPNATASFVPLKKTGEPLRAAPLDRAGIYFVEHVSAVEMQSITPRLKDFVRVEVISNA
jgi:biotin carboxylase